jgi:hypothetical protein
VLNIARTDLRINRYVYQEKLCISCSKRRIYVDNRILLEKEILDLLKEGYEIEDQEQAIYRFVPQLKKTMKIE